MSGFDPAGLQNVDLSFDDADIVDAEKIDLSSIMDNESRRKCAGLKMAARIVGVAAASASAGLDDEAVVATLGEVFGRVQMLRKIALVYLDADRNSRDFPAIFNAVSGAMAEAAIEEWKWGRTANSASRLLSPGVFAKIVEGALRTRSERFSAEMSGFDVATLRRLCLMEIAARMYGLVNLFDYYQRDAEALAVRLLNAVSEEAENALDRVWTRPEGNEWSVADREVLHRLYLVSANLLCEVYKAAAAADVMKLREMPELDRSIHIAALANCGGMPIEHVLERHRDAMSRAMGVALAIEQSRKAGI